MRQGRHGHEMPKTSSLYATYSDSVKNPGSSDSILPGLCLFPYGNTAANALECLEKFIHLEDADFFCNYCIDFAKLKKRLQKPDLFYCCDFSLSFCVHQMFCSFDTRLSEAHDFTCSISASILSSPLILVQLFVTVRFARVSSRIGPPAFRRTIEPSKTSRLLTAPKRTSRWTATVGWKIYTFHWSGDTPLKKWVYIYI